MQAVTAIIVKLDEGCGHFEDLETITKGQAKSEKDEKEEKTMPRSRTMKRLKTQQQIQKEIRQKDKQTGQGGPDSPREDDGEEEDGDEMEVQRNHLLLGIAMAANIGGTGVVTGTPPNLVAPDILGKKFGEGPGEEIYKGESTANQPTVE